MKKRYIVLLILILLPALIALCGYNSYTDSPPDNLPLIRALLVNPGTIAVIGGIVGLLLYRQRAMYWGMIVSFFYSYLALGLVWGTFRTDGIFGNHTLTTSTLLSVVGFVAALFTMLLTRVMRKAIEGVNNPEVPTQPARPQRAEKQQSTGKRKPR